MTDPINIELTPEEQRKQESLAALINVVSLDRRREIISMLVVENLKLAKENSLLRLRMGLEPRPGYEYMAI